MVRSFPGARLDEPECTGINEAYVGLVADYCLQFSLRSTLLVIVFGWAGSL